MKELETIKYYCDNSSVYEFHFNKLHEEISETHKYTIIIVYEMKNMLYRNLKFIDAAKIENTESAKNLFLKDHNIKDILFATSSCEDEQTLIKALENLKKNHSNFQIFQS